MTDLIKEVDFVNSQDSSEIFDEYSPESIDFEQTWRIHLLDMLAPYCEHDTPAHQRSARGVMASTFWQEIMNDCSKWEKEQGF